MSVDEGASPAHVGVLGALEGTDLAARGAEVDRLTAADGVTHGAGAGAHPYRFDPVPRVLDGAEWDALAAGVAQRVRALDAFLVDLHGPRAALRAGVVPEEAVASSRYLERDLEDVEAPPVRIGLAGPDVVRDADGALVVLEDNVRTPTMLAYAVAARRAVAPGAPGAPRPVEAPLRELSRWMLRAAAPGVEEPRVVVLGDVAESAVAWELRALAGLVGVALVELDDLRVRGDDLVLADGGARVDVVWRRTSEERLRDDAGALTPLGALLTRPLRAGTVRVVNAFGAGVADDKRLYPHVEDLVRFHLGEEPLLRSVRAWSPTTPAGLEELEARLGELVVKPRSGSGGHGVLIGPAASAEERAATLAAVRADPGEWIAQELVDLSTHPTVVDGALRPRHVDLRPFAFSDGREVRVAPGGFTRWASAEGDLVVNSSQGGGGKDTWVLP